MTKYLKECRIVGLAGLVCFALSALPAAPARATVTCPPATTNPKYCTTVVTVSVEIIIQNGTVTVTIHVTDPHLKVVLQQKHKAITLFDGDASGRVMMQFPKPTAPGTYAVRTVATRENASKTVVTHFTIKKHTKHTTHTKHKAHR